MTDPSRYCSLGQRGWTDLVLNMTSITHEDVEYHLVDLADLRYPRETFPTIVHELAHHWCFTSPVATTLALLHARALRTAVEREERIRFHIPTADVDQNLADDITRYETAIAYLRPIAEGIAMFAEFDAHTRQDASFFSIPMRWIYLAYTQPSQEELQTEPGAALIPFLAELRLSPYYRRRKTELLLQAFHGQGSEYLLGYLTIKRLYATGVRRTKAFQNSDFALIFFRDWFYNDFGFVDAILNDAAGFAAGEVIAKYVNERLYEFVTTDLDAYAQALVAELDANVPPPSVNDSLDEQLAHFARLTNSSIAQRGVKRVRELHDDLSAPERAMTTAGQKLREHLHWNFLQRELMCVASINVMNEPLPEQMVRATLNGQPLFDAQLLPGEILDAPAPGTLEYHINPNGPYHLFAISDTAGHPLAMYPLGAPTDENFLRRFRGQRFSLAYRTRITDALRDATESIIQQVQGRDLARLRELLPDLARAYCFNVVFDTEDDHPLRTSTTGLLTLLGNDLAFLTDLGAVSLAYSCVGSQRSAYRELGALLGEDFDATLARFQREVGNDTFHFFDLDDAICSPYF